MAEDTEGPEIEVAPPSSSNQNTVMGIVMGAAGLISPRFGDHQKI